MHPTSKKWDGNPHRFRYSASKPLPSNPASIRVALTHSSALQGSVSPARLSCNSTVRSARAGHHCAAGNRRTTPPSSAYVVLPAASCRRRRSSSDERQVKSATGTAFNPVSTQITNAMVAADSTAGIFMLVVSSLRFRSDPELRHPSGWRDKRAAVPPLSPAAPSRNLKAPQIRLD